MTKMYSELRRIQKFEDRFEYLKLGSRVGSTTFGFDRHVNQTFYRSAQWKQLRNHVIARDIGCDLGVDGYEINGSLLIHHMNPIAIEDIVDGDPDILDPEFLITTTQKTHNAIHFGDSSLLPKAMTVRRPGDTNLW